MTYNLNFEIITKSTIDSYLLLYDILNHATDCSAPNLYDTQSEINIEEIIDSSSIFDE